MSRVCAIHQPNFFPWLGYFDKIARSDVFVVLDDVQYQKTGSSWSNRVRLLVGGEERWATAPVRRPAHGTARINELSWADDPWRDKLERTLAINYRGAAHYAQAMALLQPLIANQQVSVAQYNLAAIRALSDALGLRPRMVLASEFGVGSSSSERLIALCRHVGCDTYLAGGGAQHYQKDGLFEAAGVKVSYQAFRHPAYAQRGMPEFVPGLSVIDALMHCGVAGTRTLLAMHGDG